MSDKLTLITNIDYVHPHGSDIRLYVYALLIEQNKEKNSLGPTSKIRGFLTDGSLPVFDKFLNSFPHPIKMTSAKSQGVFIGNDGEMSPLSTGAVLELAGGEKFDLFANDSRRPMDVAQFTDYEELWEALPGKVAQYWTAPNMPLPQWVSADAVRRKAVKA